MNKERTGQLIKEARIKSGLTQAELGDMLGVTNKAVSRWENGESFPDVGVLEALSGALHIGIEEIVTGGEADEDVSKTLTDLVNTVKLQKRVNRRWVIVTIVAALYGCLLIYLGIVILGGRTSFAKDAAVSVLASMMVFVLVYSFTTRSVAGTKYTRTDVAVMIISVVSAFYCVIIMWSAASTVLAGRKFFGLDESRIGPFINSQLSVIFIMNLFFLTVYVVQGIRNRETFRFTVVPAGTAVMLALIYSDMLHNMSTADGFMSAFGSVTGQVCFLIAIVTITKIGIEKKKRVSQKDTPR